MSKNTMNNGKNNAFSPPREVSELPPGEKQVHCDYGLRISAMSLKSNGGQHHYRNVKSRQFFFFSLSHLIEGKAWYWQPGEDIKKCSAGSAIMSTPQSIQDYGGDGADYIEDYICFAGPVAEHLFKCGIIKPGIIKMGSTRRLLPIIEKALDPSDDAQIAANIALQQLLVDLYFENKKSHTDTRLDVIGQLVGDINKDVFRWWTVKEMAVYCNISENHFRSLFKKYTGMSPKNYLERLKIRWAAEYLCSTSDPIFKIAEKLGYVDPYHFSKTFKRVTGLAPDHYRKQYSVFG